MNDRLTGFVGATASIPSRTLGELTVEAASFTDAIDGDLVVHFGKPFEQAVPLVRIHSECVFAQVLDSSLCDCADQLHMALKRIQQEEHGLLFYLRLDGRGAGLAAKVKATALEVAGEDTYESRIQIGVAPEGRQFLPIGEYLAQRGIRRVRLLTNNPDKAAGLRNVGIEVATERLIVDPCCEAVQRLYQTKRDRFHHDIP
ncbi:MAG: hypothetical protein IT428_09760 [Planctomycetaceae bacterium]|nr:hypothetical protein [Planctomycetaceae bacterium]